MADETFEIVVFPDPNGQVPEPITGEDMKAAGWSLDDPGKGKAILDSLGREVLNPMPFAPPLGFRGEPTIMDRLEALVNQRMAQLQDDDFIEETEADRNDFDMDDGEDFESVYTVTMAPEVPRIPDAPQVVPPLPTPEPIAPQPAPAPEVRGPDGNVGS